MNTRSVSVRWIVAALSLAPSSPALAMKWSIMTAKEIQSGRVEHKFPEIPVFYCLNLLNLGNITDEMVQANIQGALHEWFHAGADLRPYLAGQGDAAACATGAASAGTIMIRSQVAKPVGTTLMTVTVNHAIQYVGSGWNPPPNCPDPTKDCRSDDEITSATITLWTDQASCSGTCRSANYPYRDSNGAPGTDLWTAVLSGLGKAFGLSDAADAKSVVGTPIGQGLNRHLLLHDFTAMASLYPPIGFGPVWNEGYTTGDPADQTKQIDLFPSVTNTTEFRYAFHETGEGPSPTAFVPSSVESYGATEVSPDQPAACYSDVPPSAKAYRFFIALTAFNLPAQIFDGKTILTYTTDGSANGALRSSVAVTNSFRAPAVGCSPAAYLLAWVDQSDQSIHVSNSVDGVTWKASTLNGPMKSYLTPAVAYEKASGRFLILYADTASGRLNLAISTNSSGTNFGAPAPVPLPVRAGNPPPPNTEFVPGIACPPAGGTCLAGWGPGSIGAFAFDDANKDFGLVDIKVTNGAFTTPDMGWPPFRGWGVSIGANSTGANGASVFIVAANEAPERLTNFVTVARAGGVATATPGTTGSHGSALSILWGGLYDRWFTWGTGSYLYGN